MFIELIVAGTITKTIKPIIYSPDAERMTHYNTINGVNKTEAGPQTPIVAANYALTKAFRHIVKDVNPKHIVEASPVHTEAFKKLRVKVLKQSVLVDDKDCVAVSQTTPVAVSQTTPVAGTVTKTNKPLISSHVTDYNALLEEFKRLAAGPFKDYDFDGFDDDCDELELYWNE